MEVQIHLLLCLLNVLKAGHKLLQSMKSHCEMGFRLSRIKGHVGMLYLLCLQNTPCGSLLFCVYLAVIHKESEVAEIYILK